jgi:hypothetical protein
MFFLLRCEVAIENVKFDLFSLVFIKPLLQVLTEAPIVLAMRERGHLHPLCCSLAV